MGDFYQNSYITTLHEFRKTNYTFLENELIKFSKKTKMALIIPSLYSELKGAALPNIIDKISEIPYINEIVIGLDKATKDEFLYSKEYFNKLQQHHKQLFRVIWNDGPNMLRLNSRLEKENLAPLLRGKGRNAWFCFGYLIASGKSDAIALHDADILTYNKLLLARLFYPIVNPSFNFFFCKGYYFRADKEKLNGRVVRLLVTPLLRTLKKIFGTVDFIEYLDSFRYPLAGEFSMRTDVINSIRIPSDWGLEIGILSEILRLHSANRICQVDIADKYDHKHQSLSQYDYSKGISRMVHDVTSAIFAKMTQNGIEFSPSIYRTIKSTYHRIALEYVERYAADSALNNLHYDFHAEEKTVDIFANIVYKAGMDLLDKPFKITYIPCWKRVSSAIPSFMDDFFEAVELDNQ